MKKKTWLLRFTLGMVLLVPQLWLATYTREDAWIPVLVVCAVMGLFTPQLNGVFGRFLE